MSNIHKLKPPPQRDGVNPTTGRPWTLADPEIQAELACDIQAMIDDPKKARDFLQDVGILTSQGNLSIKYGGR